MSFRSCFFSVILAPVVAFGLPSDQEVKDRMIRDVDSIQSTFEVKYAPADWKKRYAGWDLDTEIQKTKDRIASIDGMSIKGYQRAVKQFFMSTKDYHVGVTFWSTERASLPFRVCGVNGKYYITYIDRSKLPTRSFSFQIGDELVMFDQRPTHEVVQELLQDEVGNSSPDTDYALAEIYLTMRRGKLGHLVPRGPLTIDVGSAKTGAISSYQIIWDYSPEKIKEPFFRSLDLPPRPQEGEQLARHSFFRKQMTIPAAKIIMEGPRAESICRDPNEMGARESFIPPLGKILWQTHPLSKFHAYLFETANHQKIGYVRIPDYDTGREGEDGEVSVAIFADTIAYLERHSSALVIDQVNNPGGSLFYLYALASLLTDQPLHTPRHRTTITQEDVAFAVGYERLFAQINNDTNARRLLGDTMEGYPINYQTSQFMLQFFRFIIDEWNAGRTLTNPYYLYGVDCINPQPGIRYTKPILLLVNRLCFSAGDFLPAILQDNKRVTIFGSKTAGAGGYVDGCSYHNPYGVASIHYTASIAERIDNNPIENLGVTPDICYEITEDDLQHNFRGYVHAVLDALEGLSN